MTAYDVSDRSKPEAIILFSVLQGLFCRYAFKSYNFIYMITDCTFFELLKGKCWD